MSAGCSWLSREVYLHAKPRVTHLSQSCLPPHLTLAERKASHAVGGRRTRRRADIPPWGPIAELRRSNMNVSGISPCREVRSVRFGAMLHVAKGFKLPIVLVPRHDYVGSKLQMVFPARITPCQPAPLK